MLINRYTGIGRVGKQFQFHPFLISLGRYPTIDDNNLFKIQ